MRDNVFDPQAQRRARRFEIVAVIGIAVGLLLIGFALGAKFGRGWMC